MHRRAWSFVTLLALACMACAGNPVAARDRYLSAGDAYAVRGRLNEAIIEYRNAAARDRKAPAPHVRLGDRYLELDRPADALREWDLAVALGSHDAALLLKDGSLALALGDRERAESRARGVLDREPRNVDAHLLLANAALGGRDIYQAVRLINEAIEMDPTNARGYTALGELQWMQDDRKAAEVNFAKAVDIDPSSVRAHVSLGEYYARTNRPLAAEREFTRARNLAPNDPLVNAAAGEFYLEIGRGADAEPLARALSTRLGGAAGAIVLARYFVRVGRAQDALDTIRPFVQRPGSRASDVAAIALAAGDPSSASNLVRAALKKNSADAAALTVGAMIAAQSHDWVNLEDFAARAAAIRPGDWRAHHLLGVAQASTDALTDAQASFREAIRLNPYALVSRLALARATALAGDTRETIAVLDDTYHDPRRAAKAANDLAWSLVQHDQALPAARDIAAEAARRLPERPEPHDTLGTAYLKLGDREHAAAEFRRSLRILPQDPIYMSHLAAAR